MTKKKTTPAKKAPVKKAPAKKTTAKKAPAKKVDPCAMATSAKSLAEHFRNRESVPSECMSKWTTHGHWLAKKEGIPFSAR